jgi:hypothetical protein
VESSHLCASDRLLLLVVGVAGDRTVGAFIGAEGVTGTEDAGTDCCEAEGAGSSRAAPLGAAGTGSSTYWVSSCVTTCGSNAVAAAGVGLASLLGAVAIALCKPIPNSPKFAPTAIAAVRAVPATVAETARTLVRFMGPPSSRSQPPASEFLAASLGVTKAVTVMVIPRIRQLRH